MSPYGVTQKDVESARQAVESFRELRKTDPVAAKKLAADFLERCGVTENGKPKKQIVTQGTNW